MRGGWGIRNLESCPLKNLLERKTQTTKIEQGERSTTFREGRKREIQKKLKSRRKPLPSLGYYPPGKKTGGGEYK